MLIIQDSFFKLNVKSGTFFVVIYIPSTAMGPTGFEPVTSAV